APFARPGRAFAVNGDVPMGVDPAHEPVSISAINGGAKSRVRSVTTVVHWPRSCATQTPYRPGRICIGPPPLPAFSFTRQLATNKGWRTHSQSSWKVPARRRIETAGRDISEIRWKEGRS